MYKLKSLQSLRHHQQKTSCEAEALMPSPAFRSLMRCGKSAPANILGWDRTGAETPLQILQAAKIFIRIFSEILILESSRRNFTASLSPTSWKAEFKAKF